MNRLLNEQLARNADSRGSWELFAAHRRQVTEHLLGLACGRRLCVLGAGNSNDLDLDALLGAFDEVHLVDLDADALRQGAAAQPLQASRRSRLHLHGGVDLTGVLERMARWSPDAWPEDAGVAECLAEAGAAAAPGLPAPFDMVASVCVLTQLIEAVSLSLGEQHPRALELMLALRTRHLRLMAELLAPGGWGLLVTDVVSSVTCPELLTAQPEALEGVICRAIDERNFFHGVNPAVLGSLLHHNQVGGPRVGRCELLPPWTWNLGPRTYAVCCLRFQRQAE